MKHSAPLTREFESRLRAYALAAGATGIGLLVSAQSSEAEIIYTPANVTITNQGNAGYLLDLNGDGVKDFFIQGPTSRTALYVIGLDGNRVFGIESFGSSACYASALEAGRIIGQRYRECLQSYDIVIPYGGGGRWQDVKGRYLGFQFKIGPRTHYGWARLSVHVNGNVVTARLTGYAYQAAPDKPIRAGQISDDEDLDATRRENANSDPVTMLANIKEGSLGALALGSSRLAK